MTVSVEAEAAAEAAAEAVTAAKSVAVVAAAAPTAALIDESLLSSRSFLSLFSRHVIFPSVMRRVCLKLDEETDAHGSLLW